MLEPGRLQKLRVWWGDVEGALGAVKDIPSSKAGFLQAKLNSFCFCISVSFTSFPFLNFILHNKFARKQGPCSIRSHQLQVLIPCTSHNPLFVIITILPQPMQRHKQDMTSHRKQTSGSNESLWNKDLIFMQISSVIKIKEKHKSSRNILWYTSRIPSR